MAPQWPSECTWRATKCHQHRLLSYLAALTITLTHTYLGHSLMLAGMAWSMCSSTWKSCSRGPAPERSLLPSPPSPHHPARDARGSAITNHEDMPSPELADRALVDARAAESSAYESTFSSAVERSVDERHERPLVERDGRGAGALVAARE